MERGILRVLDKIKSISHIVLVAVVTASFVVVANKTCSTLSNFSNVATKVDKVLANEDINGIIKNMDEITKNINKLTGNDLEKLKKLISEFDNQDIQSIKGIISNLKEMSEDGKVGVKVLREKACEKYFGFFKSYGGKDGGIFSGLRSVVFG